MARSKMTSWVAAVGYTLCLACSTAGQKDSSPAMDPEAPAALQEAVLARLASSRSTSEMDDLALLEGNWELVLESASSSEDSPARIGSGRATLTRILGDRFIEWRTLMDVAGQTLASRGLLGYDEAFERYEFLWVSELSGAQRLARGRGHARRAGLLLEYVDNDALSGDALRRQSLLRIVDSDHFVLEQRGYDPDSSEWLAIVRTRYTRAAQSAAQ